MLGLLAGLTASAVADPANGGTESNLGLGAGSHAIALGGANLARLGDASALYWNPAALALLERGDIALMHAPISYGDASQTFFGLAYPTLGAGSFALGYLRVGRAVKSNMRNRPCSSPTLSGLGCLPLDIPSRWGSPARH